MCRVSVNGNIKIYKSIVRNEKNSVISYLEPFDTIEALNVEEKAFLSNFYVTVTINLMKTENQDMDLNVINNNGSLACQIKLNKVDENYNPISSIIIYEFILDAANNNGTFLNATNTFEMPSVQLDEDFKGNYTFTLLVKRINENNSDNDFSIQSILPLYVF